MGFDINLKKSGVKTKNNSILVFKTPVAVFDFARLLSHPKKRANSAMRSKKTCLHSLSHNCITASDDTELGPHIDSAHMGVKSFLKLLFTYNFPAYFLQS